jgi:hypothetical protein
MSDELLAALAAIEKEISAFIRLSAEEDSLAEDSNCAPADASDPAL